MFFTDKPACLKAWKTFYGCHQIRRACWSPSFSNVFSREATGCSSRSYSSAWYCSTWITYCEVIFLHRVDASILLVLCVLNTSSFLMCRYSPVARSFYSPNLGTRQQLGDGLESWRGFYQSIRPTQMGLSLNIG
jgi:hypothetical protein